jgi:cyclase
MLAKRIIACLDVRDGVVVKGTSFRNLQVAGDPAELAERYNNEGIDELVMLDVTATLEGRAAALATVRRIAERVFIPLVVGGGIRDESDAAAMFDAGADKVAVNSAALRDPDVISRLAARYGRQAVIVAIDALRAADGWAVYGRSGTSAETWEARAWAAEAERRGAGEILLTSIDRDGTREGFDCDLTAAVSTAAGIPVIASGGAGSVEDFRRVLTDGAADAALAASLFHFGEVAIPELKRALGLRGIPMRTIAEQLDDSEAEFQTSDL